MHAAATSLIIEIFIYWYCIFMCQEEHCQTVYYYEDVVKRQRLDVMWAVCGGAGKTRVKAERRQAFDGKTLN